VDPVGQPHVFVVVEVVVEVVVIKIYKLLQHNKVFALVVNAVYPLAQVHPLLPL